MDTRASSTQGGGRSLFASSVALAPAVLLCVSCLGLANCASPGEPIERRAPIPASITDLSAEQSGNNVVLTCTIPRESVNHTPLAEVPSVEIYRAIYPSPGSSSSAASVPLALLVTIPSALVSDYTREDHFRYTDAMTAGDFLPNHQQSVASYLIRTSASPKKQSSESNRVELPVYPSPLPIGDVRADATESAIHLAWTAPAATLTGEKPQIAGYHIYRASGQASTLAPASGTPTLGSSPVEIGESTSPEYLDTDVEKNKTYIYSVRTAFQTPAKPLESADSNSVAITLRDVFPPSAPTGLIATPVAPEETSAAHVDLSWAINPETDLAGYNVYRSEQAGGSETRLNSQPLPTPAFRDMNAAPGQTYHYRVTAVDRSGNESAASPTVEARLASTGSAGRIQVAP